MTLLAQSQGNLCRQALRSGSLTRIATTLKTTMPSGERVPSQDWHGSARKGGWGNDLSRSVYSSASMIRETLANLAERRPITQLLG